MKLGISEAFRKYGATLKNANWSVSSWANDKTLVVSLWDHHCLKSYDPGTLAFGDRFDRWSGPGNKEFRANVTRAFEIGAVIRLVLTRAKEPGRVQLGEDGSKIPKIFTVRNDLIGRVAEINGENYLIEFRKSAA